MATLFVLVRRRRPKARKLFVAVVEQDTPGILSELVIRDHVIRDQTLDRKKKFRKLGFLFWKYLGPAKAVFLKTIGLQGAVRAVFFKTFWSPVA